MQKVFVSENGIECEYERSFFLSEKYISVLENPYFMKTAPVPEDEYDNLYEHSFA